MGERDRNALHPVASPPEGRRLDRWMPAADIYRTRRGWLVKLELAGVRPDDVQVCISGHRVKVAGVRRDDLVRSCAGIHLMEISYDYFERTVELAESVEAARWTVEYRHGMLLIEVMHERR